MEKGGIVVFGGTAEGRELALAICRRCPGREVWVSVAKAYAGIAPMVNATATNNAMSFFFIIRFLLNPTYSNA